MPWISPENIVIAKSVDLLTYLQNTSPHELKQTGPNEYRSTTYSSLVISNGLWIRNKCKSGGRSAIDFLMKIKGMSFLESVSSVLDSTNNHIEVSLDKTFSKTHQNASNKEPPKKFTFYPPRPIKYSNKAITYLQSRGISPEVINNAIDQGILFESRYYNPKSPHHNIPICVFAGKDTEGKIAFTAMRGINVDFKKDKAGSNKAFNFTLPARTQNSHQLMVFESPIDLLSHATLQQRNGWNTNAHRLSLGGTSSVALISFLERNPQIKRVILHLDNDKAGIHSASIIKKELKLDPRFSHITISIKPPRHNAKDYNDVLLQEISKEKDKLHLNNMKKLNHQVAI